MTARPSPVHRLRSRAALVLTLVVLAFAFASFGPTRASEGAAFGEYVVAADHPDASQAGAAVLAQGGNAADAAAATMLALGVVSPSSSGLGGGGFALYYRAKDRTLTFLDFRETAPAKATSELFAAQASDSADTAAQRSRKGGLAVAVPGEPLGISELVKRFGTLPLSAVIAPAEKLARTGFGISAHTVGTIGRVPGGNPLLTRVFGEKPEAGRQARNVALADTLARFAREGAPLFYRGALAKDIVRTVREHGGIISAEDLAAYRVVTREPLRGTALGYDWATAPLPSAGGYTLIESLAMLERWLPTDAHFKGAERYHALIESWKGLYMDRQRYFGDPDHVQVPLAALSDPKRRSARAERYHPALALSPSAYEIPLPDAPPAAVQPDNRGTSHLCVVDREGNVAAVTTTVNLTFGAKIPVRGLWLNNEMDDFAREVGKENAFGLVGGAPNLPAPGKRPISSMTPTIAFKDGAPVLCVGGSGGSRIPTAVEQVALYVLRDGMHPAQAIAAPRLHHQADPPKVDARGLPEAMVNELKRRGHDVQATQWAAHVQAIRIHAGPERKLDAASDEHKGGVPAGK
jgi:gamma-glutamyltranspeptidase/glutathione hydrolase